MRQICRMLGAIVAVIVMVAGLAATGWAQGAPAGGGGDQEAAGPAGASRPLDMPILYVTGIEVVHGTMDPKIEIIHVSGLTSSKGWSNPQLVPFFYGKPGDDVFDLQFIASSPLQSQKADGFVPIDATFALQPGHAFKGIRVRASANALELKQMSGVAHAGIKAVDCKSCVGKKFVEKGKSQAGGADVVREEDLPRGFRVITPTHGVAGIVHNPNRLDLILGDDHTIVMAFWE